LRGCVFGGDEPRCYNNLGKNKGRDLFPPEKKRRFFGRVENPPLQKIKKQNVAAGFIPSRKQK